MENEAMVLAEEMLKIGAYILIVGMFSSKVSQRFKIPDVVLFLLAGIIIGPPVLHLISIDFHPIANQFILVFGSAFILYDGGRDIGLKVLNDVKITVGLLAIPGVIITTFLFGFIVQWAFDIPMIYALLTASIVASTDPATLVPVFKQVKIKDRVKQTVISESAFNDATGAIMVFAVLGVITTNSFSLGGSIVGLLTKMAIGILVGIFVGFLSSMVISDKRYGIFDEFAPLVSVFSVIVSFMLAEKMYGSGYMATFITGLVVGNQELFKIPISKQVFENEHNVKDSIATMMRMAIFILLGTNVDFTYLSKYFKESILVVLLFIFVVRPVVVLALAVLDRKCKWSMKEMIFMMWTRETGVIPAALSSMILNMSIIEHKGVISSVVVMTILITIGLQASTTEFFAKKLGLLEKDVKQTS